LLAYTLPSPSDIFMSEARRMAEEINEAGGEEA
jgi:hypothetical protein